MNFYFVFEGKTEHIVYREWFKVLLPELTEVDFFDEVDNNNYYYESDMGIPDCYNVVANAVQEINEHPRYDYLILFVDADRYSVAERKAESLQFIEERLNDIDKDYTFKKLPENCKLVVIVQKVCIETWFLGNRTFCPRQPENILLKSYIDYFDINKENPEDLAAEFIQNEEGTAQIFGYSTKALFHESYLKEVFKERLQGMGYKKSRPREVQKKTYLEQLIARIMDDNAHLLSFQEFITFCEQIQKELSNKQ